MQPGTEPGDPMEHADSQGPDGTAEELVAAHARSLERAVAGEFERQTRRTPFATPARVAGLATTLLRNLGEDLLNDFLMMADRLSHDAPARKPPTGPGRDEAGARAEWAMRRVSEALVEGADELEAAAPAAMRPRVAQALQICRVDFEWRCRTALGLPSPTGSGETDLFDPAGIW